MANYQTLTPHVFKGRGHAARAVGVPYDVYRVTNTSTGDVIVSGNKIAASFYVLRKAKKGGPGFETTTELKTLWYTFIADTTTFIVGDIFLQNDPVYGTGYTIAADGTQQFNAICLAFNPPIGKSAMGARLDRIGQIFRPTQNIDNTAYWVPSQTMASPLVLTSGNFTFQSSGSASNIPMGMMPFARPSGGEQFSPAVPGQTPYPHFYVYIPPLPGIVLQEGDRIIGQNGDQMVVLTPWNQQAGVAGLQLLCMRVLSGAGM